MSNLIEKRPTPETIYVSESGQRIYVEDVIGEEDDEFYLVMTVPAEDKDDMDAMGDELDSQQWVEMMDTLGLEPEVEVGGAELEQLRSMFTKQ
ncbi:hypothetical protein ACNO5E_25580 [Vibrio parahaemolyticus]|uniref:hypothetical protein n=1 Tax=Vibrio sp. OPT46 TaxID=2778645 RepID=UPI0018815806|nr:hypothetical protein [Vibrio sp. OPT46]MBE8572727.1 hypothetical protein [Vibrio sp. OPT46]